MDAYLGSFVRRNGREENVLFEVKEWTEKNGKNHSEPLVHLTKLTRRTHQALLNRLKSLTLQRKSTR